MIKEFYSKLSEQEKMLFYGATAIIVLAFFDLLFLRPVASKLKILDTGITEKINYLKRDVRFLAYKDKILKEREEFSIYFTDEMRAEDKITADFLETIEVLASEAEINLVKLNPSDVVLRKGHKLYHANLECKGNLQDMIKFMYKIDVTQNLLRVVKMDMKGNKASAEGVDASFRISKLVIDPKSIGSREFIDDEEEMIEGGFSKYSGAGNAQDSSGAGGGGTAGGAGGTGGAAGGGKGGGAAGGTGGAGSGKGGAGGGGGTGGGAGGGGAAGGSGAGGGGGGTGGGAGGAGGSGGGGGGTGGGAGGGTGGGAGGGAGGAGGGAGGAGGGSGGGGAGGGAGGAGGGAGGAGGGGAGGGGAGGSGGGAGGGGAAGGSGAGAGGAGGGGAGGGTGGGGTGGGAGGGGGTAAGTAGGAGGAGGGGAAGGSGGGAGSGAGGRARGAGTSGPIRTIGDLSDDGPGKSEKGAGPAVEKSAEERNKYQKQIEEARKGGRVRMQSFKSLWKNFFGIKPKPKKKFKPGPRMTDVQRKEMREREEKGSIFDRKFGFKRKKKK